MGVMGVLVVFFLYEIYHGLATGVMNLPSKHGEYVVLYASKPAEFIENLIIFFGYVCFLACVCWSLFKKMK